MKIKKLENFQFDFGYTYLLAVFWNWASRSVKLYQMNVRLALILYIKLNQKFYAKWEEKKCITIDTNWN